MGSERDSESPHSSVSGVPNPNCHGVGKRQGRISFSSLFHGKRGSRTAPKAGVPPHVSLHHHMPQQLLPAALNSAPVPVSTGNTSAPAAAATQQDLPLSACSKPLSSSRQSLSGTPSSGESSLLECPLCLVRQPAEQLPELLGCSHRSCLCCLRQYLP
ncbi:unnamed protein product, partial [Tetraodon nigroviridis]